MMLAVAGGAALLLAAYQFGVVETLGCEWKHQTGRPLTSSQSGGYLGFKSLYLSAGTTVFVNYDVDVRSGSLWIGLMRSCGVPGQKPHFHHRVQQTSQGEICFQITEPGWYELYFDGSPTGERRTDGLLYDVNYLARWGIR